MVLFSHRLNVDCSFELHEVRLFLQKCQAGPGQEVGVCLCSVLEILVEVVQETLEFVVLVHVDHLRLVLSEEPVEVAHVSHLLVRVPRSQKATCTARRTRSGCVGNSSGKMTFRTARPCGRKQSLSLRACFIILCLLAQLIACYRSEAGRLTKIFAHFDESDFELLVVIGNGELLVCQGVIMAAASRITSELFVCWLSLI